MNLPFDASPVFERNADAFLSEKKLIINQGGARSGKTYSILQLLITLAFSPETRYVCSVVSVSFPHLRQGAIRDFLNIMHSLGIFYSGIWNKSSHTYTFASGGIIEFFSIENSGKARGSGRDVLFVNECNLIDEETFMQLLIRTRGKVLIDYNPADEFHWIYDKLIPRDDAVFIQSTYRDNPFLPAAQIREIERMRDTDENRWRVYGLGEKGRSSETVYTHWQVGRWDSDRVKDWCYGLDFGFNVPTALVKCGFTSEGVIWEEVIYEAGINNSELITRLRETIPDSERKKKKIYADAAEPQRIEEIRRAGFTIEAAMKDVEKGIDYVRGSGLTITRESYNLLKEIKSYSYKKDRATGRVLDEPIKLNDHALDAGRYAVATYLHKPKGKATFGSTIYNRYQ